MFSPIFLYIPFFHIFVFVKEISTIRNQKNAIVSFDLEFIHNWLIVMLPFKILILMSEILLLSLINFLKKLLLMFALIMHFFIDAKKAKIFKCAYFNFIKTPKNVVKAFFNYFN